MTAPVLAADSYATNGHLIAAVAQLGYLTLEDHVLDPTYERGIWWQEWRPRQLSTHHRAVDGTDFRHLPYPDATFDAIAFDPPYVCPGGRKTSTVKPMHERYGMKLDIKPEDVVAEGFPGWSPTGFVGFFTNTFGVREDVDVTVIEWEYL